ncbi:hypothetical protein PVV74_11655 [Roseovarius sp. SK2]|uniref:hypothetical protein n=1 Tax=Roseovarius TaxID=74030 RepID=UPI00237B6F6E|nr:hypothetical protein [Roseovarius sp. SK2]MDD9726112.1 hypothetical protein [Roseovarius sp. SK2]
MNAPESPHAGEDHQTTVAVIHALKDGLGVEDMQVQGIASADYARRVIDRLRNSELIAHVVAPKSREARTLKGAKLS